MDTNKDSAASDVPTFKVARVGGDRKRKGGAFSFLRGGGTRGVWSGASGGSGAAVSAAGLSISKAMLTILVSSVIGTASIYYGAHSASGSSAAPQKAAIFSQDKNPIKLEGDTSNLPGNTNTIPNSLGYLTGSKDGLTPEERAKKEADAAAAAEAQRIADEEAAKKAEQETAAAPVDPAALLASAQGDGDKGAKGSAFGKKFGSLSSSMGGASLSGGAGLSGGVNRQFGSAGSLGKGTGGQLSAMRGSSKASTSKASASRLAASRTKGFARRQLANTNAYSRRGMAAGKGETASSDASSAFDNNPGAGNIISGPGIAKGTKPTGAEGGATSEGGPTGGDGGSGDPTVDCGPDNYQTADGGCAPIQTNKGKDAKPELTMMANTAMVLMALVGVLALMSTGANGVPIVGTLFSLALSKIILVLGIMITLLGVAMMAMGDYVTGGIATLIGGTTTVLSWPGLTAGLTAGEGMVLGFGGAALSMVGKMMDKGNHKEKAPVAAQQ